MQQLTFVTNNLHKIHEVQDIFSKSKTNITILSLADNNIQIDIPEPYNTFEENSAHKAKTIYEKYKINCFAEDAGLMIDALDWEPGVFSARYAWNHDDEKNIRKVLKKLEWKEKRTAKFVAVTTLIIDGKIYQFKGECIWTIAEKWDWNLSFGYDPIFIPDGYKQTFAILGDKIKSQISHRKKAIEQMLEFLQKNQFNVDIE